MNSRGYLDISFSWIFAILIGGLIIFGAFYGLTRYENIARTKGSAESVTEFNVLLSPLETDMESGKILSLVFPIETRVSNVCQITSTFGRQGFSINEKIRGRWTENPLEIYAENRYVFSQSTLEGKKFYSFSKPLEMPFKVADLIYLIPEKDIYCFSGNIPREIERELETFNHQNFLTENCNDRQDVIKVCFSEDSGCDIKINYDEKYILKGEEKIYFSEDALLYAAIFSDKRNYECGVKRILYRTKILAELYQEKGVILEAKGCSFSVSSGLPIFISKISQIEDSGDLYLIQSDVGELKRKNRHSYCRLW